MKKKLVGGFTLIELMIVIAIAAIIAAIAIPSYNDSVSKSRRAEGRAFILEAAQAMERHYSEFGRYADSINTGGNVSEDTMVFNTASENGLYQLSVGQNGLSQLNNQSFTLVASPPADSPQSSDGCGAYTLTNQSVKGVQNATLSPEECW